MKKSQNKANLIISIAFTVILIFTIVFVTYAIVASKDSSGSVKVGERDFSKEWTYSENEKEIEIDLPYFFVDRLQDRYSIKKELPKDLREDAILCLKINHNDIRAYVANEELEVQGIYREQVFGISDYEKKAIIYLDESMRGEVITLEMIGQYGSVGINLENLVLTDEVSYNRGFFIKALLEILFFATTIVIAFLLLGIGIGLKLKRQEESVCLFTSLSCFVALVGVWIFLDSKILTLYFGYTTALYLASFLSLMLVPIPLAIFYREILTVGEKALNTVIGTIIGLFVVTLLLTASGALTTFTPSIMIFHGIDAVLVCMIVGLTIYDFQKRKTRDLAWLLWGALLFGGTILLALIAFYFNSELYDDCFRIGFIIFAMTLSCAAISTVWEVIRKAEEVEVQKKIAMEARNHLRLSQIGSHFFFHVMSAIRVLTKTDGDRAYQALGDFSKYLRHMADGAETNMELIPFREELSCIKSYVAIKQIILGNRLSIEYNIECDDFFVPTLVVEALVENAIIHGVEKRREGGKVLISTCQKEDGYYIIVEDNGVGFEKNDLISREGISIGAANVRERLDNYGDNSLIIKSERGKGTVATIILKSLVGGENENNSCR